MNADEVTEWLRTKSKDGVELRLVCAADAELIVELRNSEKANILPRGAQSAEEQREWISRYKSREQVGAEFYLAIVWLKETVGFVRVYDIDNAKATFAWGSWVMRPGRPAKIGLSTALLIYEFGFHALNMQYALFDVRVRNTNVVRFHQSLGAQEIRRNDLDVFFRYNRESYEAFLGRAAIMLERL